MITGLKRLVREEKMSALLYKKFFFFSPGWCGSVDRKMACELKGLQFDSQSGHMPGLQARSPVGGI